MTKHTHTPGPWQISINQRMTITGHAVGWTDTYFVYSADNTIIADNIGGGNARLISAAPEMLAALERVMTLQISAGGDEVFDDVRAALAKARGT